MRVFRFIKGFTLAAAVLWVLVLSWVAPQECKIYGDSTKCVSVPSVVTSVRLNEYYCRLEAFRRTCGTYPTTEEGLGQLIDAHTCEGALTMPMMDRRTVPGDGFGHAFQYRSQGKGFVLSSWGKDGLKGGWGEDADRVIQLSRPPLSLFGGRVIVWEKLNFCF